MSRIKSVIGRATWALVSAAVFGLTVGPEAVMRRVDDVLATSWRALGDRLVDRELNAIARQLDREEQRAGQIEALRDALTARLVSLAARREVSAQVEEGHPPRGDDSERERVCLDAAITSLRSAVARADCVLIGARKRLGERESELIVLRAASDARQMNRALDGPIDDESMWGVRVARARDFLRTPNADGEQRGIRLEASVLP
jgi:hypothetical protein